MIKREEGEGEEVEKGKGQKEEVPDCSGLSPLNDSKSGMIWNSLRIVAIGREKMDLRSVSPGKRTFQNMTINYF